MTTEDTAPAADPAPVEATAAIADALRRQEAYAASRRLWAEAVGRPYEDTADPRPPPGELDAVAEE
jgi:hypothetical protein